MGYLGLVPSEDSTGDTVKRGPITKAGNRRARRILVECSWSYQHPPRVGKEKQIRVAAAPPAVREIAWKAQCRLSARPGDATPWLWPAPGSEDTELGVLMELEVGHGATEVYAGVQA
jgi:hypothetical protein